MKRIFEILLIAVLLAACSVNEVPKKFIPKKADIFAKSYIDSLVNGNTEYCFSKLDKKYQNEDARTFFASGYKKLKDKELISSRIVNAQKTIIFLDNTETDYNLIYEYQYSDNLWMYYKIQLTEKENDFVIQSFLIQSEDQSLGKINEFSLNKKSFIHFLWLNILIIVVLFILITLIFAIKTPVKKKWLWIIFILTGFVSFSLNWTTGEIIIQIFNFKILGASIVRSGIIGPWIVSFSIPIGAIVFWIKRRKILNDIKKKDGNEATKGIVQLEDGVDNEKDSD